MRSDGGGHVVLSDVASVVGGGRKVGSKEVKARVLLASGQAKHVLDVVGVDR